VPGDIIKIKMGDKIPADIRVIESDELKVDNSSLTGESKLLLRTPECTAPKNALETDNLCFFGTICKNGKGKGIVINIGDETVIGQIANLAATATSATTPLRKELDRFIGIISIISIVMGIVFFAFGVILKYNFIICLIFGIGIIVANVPEGLLATVTVALSLTAKKLYTKKVLVKNIEAVETLGSTSCICSDKTGTLT
jgi:sodium/potassium-transporting ATPase subunit alpha